MNLRRHRHFDSPVGVPLNETDVSAARIGWFVGFVALFGVLLLARLWFLQIYRGELFRGQAEQNRLRLVREIAPRGMIVDAKGRVLVTNEAQFTVFVLPTDLPKDPGDKLATLTRLAKILSLTVGDLQAIMRRHDPGASNPIPVAEGVKPRVLAQIAENSIYLHGVVTSVEPFRQYPFGSLASHLIGYIGEINDKDLAKPENGDYRSGDFIGQTGIEKQYDTLLNGTPGGLYYVVDARGRRQGSIPGDPAQAGATLTLGLDRDVQRACENALAGHRGAAVAIDPRDGRVIAMASYPAYNPQLFAHRPISRADYSIVRDQGALQNLALSSAWAPGSTFKIITSAAGLASGKIDANTSEFCAGGIRLGKTFKRCDGNHGWMNLTHALEASCDTFYYRRGMAIGAATMREWARNFGLGEKTGIDMPSERKGNIPDSAKERMSYGDICNMAIGQGTTLATPMQMALVAGAIANGGTVYEPRVVLKATSVDNETLYTMTPTPTHHLPLTPGQIAQIAQGMRQVVVGPRGTSHAGNLAGVEIAGKSGSAEHKVKGSTGLSTNAWFTCFAPYEKPTIAVCVFLESQGNQHLHGGVDAAPIARHIVAADLHVPDKLQPVLGGRVAD